jgi:hypothetical protein
MKRLAASILVLSAICCGCATGPERSARGFRQYLIDRGNDFADIFMLRIAGGHGLMFSAKLSSPLVSKYVPLRLALGYIDAEKIGITGRYVGHWRQRGAEFAIPFNYAYRNYHVDPIRGNDYFDQLMAKLPKIQPDVPGEDREPNIEGLFDGPSVEYLWYQVGYDPNEYGLMGEFPKTWTGDVELKMHALYMGIDFGLSFKELWDFITGFVTLDFSKDDLASRLESEKRRKQREEAKEALERAVETEIK